MQDCDPRKLNCPPPKRRNRRQKNKLPNRMMIAEAVAPPMIRPRKREKRQQRIIGGNLLNFKLNVGEYEESCVKEMVQYKNITIHPYYRFALKVPGIYNHYHRQPPGQLDWNVVGKVFKLVQEQMRCSICLSEEFIAPRITKCGHCFCWICIIRLLKRDFRSNKACPMCYEDIQVGHLRPVEFIQVPVIEIGTVKQFSLLSRRKNEMTVHKCDQETIGLQYCNLYDSQSTIMPYNRLMLYMHEHQDLLIEQMLIQNVLEHPECEENEILACKSILNSITKDLRNVNNDDSIIFEDIPKDSCDCAMTIHPILLTPISHGKCTIHNTNKKATQTIINLKEVNIVDQSHRNSKQYYYFYAIDDGQPYFLHPTCLEILLKQFGSLENLPSQLEGVIIGIEDLLVTKDLQQIHKCLSHIPVNAKVYFAEIDLHEIVDEEILQQFSQQIAGRSALREREGLSGNQALIQMCKQLNLQNVVLLFDVLM